MEPQDVDIRAYLRDRGIRFWEEGKNISQDWIGTRCLWCDDRTNHLGIHTTKGTINCFRCPAQGTVFRLIMKIERCSYGSALTIARNFNRYRSTHISAYADKRSSKFERLGKRDYTKNILSQFDFDENALPIHEKYLEGRYFDPKHLVEKYKIKFCGPIGHYRLRIIVPVYERGVCVSFVARDATNQASTPYLNCPNDQAILDIKDTVYNIDHSKGQDVLIVEGVTDVWRIGDDCVGTFGVKYTPQQVLTLSQYRRCFVLYDTEEEAQRQARQLCNDLSTVVNDVIRLELDKGDPAEMSEDDVKSLRKQIFGKIY